MNREFNIQGTAPLTAAAVAALHAGIAIDQPARERSCPHRVQCFGALYGESKPMQRLFELIARVAPTRASVIISGESGTGKEAVARAIHDMSKQNGKPFIAVNCGAIPANLIEAELFGHERGSFTGAVRMHKGCFERAAGGTLFLDEVTEMPQDMQVKLLRVLETGRFCRIGGDQEIEASVRIIAATNRCPPIAVETGQLRADLLYRLAVFPIEVPALRDRGNDIDLLAQLFLDQLNAEDRAQKKFSAASRRFLREHRWPGNVRELKNVVQRAYILADEVLDVSAAAGPTKPAAIDGDCVAVLLGSKLADAERSLIFATLDRCRGNKTRAAQVLGVSLKTLYNRLNEYRKLRIGQPDYREMALA